jgi:prepilin-type N-terminal cleavage/methylation domain-containing protein
VAQHRSGYTLLELVIVLALLVVLVAMIYPSLETMYADYRVTSAADMVRAGWASARAHALNEGRAYRFSIYLDKGNFRIAPHSDDYWQGNNPPPSEDPSNPSFTMSGTLEKGVRFVPMESLQFGATPPGGESALPADGIDPTQLTTKVVFLPDGTIRDDVELPIQARGARPVILSIRALTGVVSKRYYTPDGGGRR